MSDFDDDVVAETVRRAIEDADAEEVRIQAFQDRVRDMPGPLGELLREVAHAWADFEQAEAYGGTTTGEEVRLRGVLGGAMSTLDWLREGVQS
jgi:hypothetical protein